MSRGRLKILLPVALVVAALACAAVALGAGGGGATTIPPGPRISFLEVRYPAKEPDRQSLRQIEEAFRFVSVNAHGKDLRRFSPPGLVTAALGNVSWSADGEEVAFLAAPATKAAAEAEETEWQIYVVGTDGSDPRAVPGTKGATRPVLSPDGASVAFSRYREHSAKVSPKNLLPWLTHHYASSTTWVVPVAGGKPRRLTPWGNGRFSSPSSFSPDGALLAVTEDAVARKETVHLLDVATGKTRRVEQEAGEAAFSPDGSRIAFSSYRDRGSAPGFDGPVAMGELYVANADFTGARRITRTPATDESAPSWAPGGDRLAFLATAKAEDFLGLAAEVIESNADGTCAKAIVDPKRGKRRDVAIQPPAWVPGEGRAVAPLSC